MDKAESLENCSLILAILSGPGNYLRKKIDLISTDTIQDVKIFLAKAFEEFLTDPENNLEIAGPICLKTHLIFDDFAVKYTESLRKLSPEFSRQLIKCFGRPYKDRINPTSDFIPESHRSLTKIAQKISRK